MIKLSYEQQIAFNSLSIIVGNALYALTVVLFLVPSGLITGGATGIALGINRALGLPVSGVLFVINMTMLTVGWVLLGFGALLTLLLAMLGDGLAGLLLASPLFLCGVICLVARKRPGLWCAWACGLLGLVWLLFRKVISWHIPVSYIATVAVLTLIFPRGGADAVQWMLYNLFGGGLMLGAIFMATDYSTSPITKKGQLIYGVGCGLFTVFIRYFGSYPEGVCYSIMVMNCVAPLIDKCTKPARFGVVKSEKKEASAK